MADLFLVFFFSHMIITGPIRRDQRMFLPWLAMTELPAIARAANEV